MTLVFNDPQENISGPHGDWWAWGCYFNNKPVKIKSGMSSALLKLLKEYHSGDTVEIVKTVKENKTTWTVNGKTLNQQQMINQSGNDLSMDQIVDQFAKIRKFLERVENQLKGMK